MRPLRPAAPIRRDRAAATPRRLALTVDSDLGAIILRMIATQSLAAFTPAVGRAESPQPVRGLSPAIGAGRTDAAATAPPQRLLEAVPPQPARPLPRGSLLDLRV